MSIVSDRVLYVSPMAMEVNNGMMQRQRQLLDALCREFPGSVDYLSLFGSPQSARTWLKQKDLDATVLDSAYVEIARINAMAWYYGGVVLCNKLRWGTHFRFPFRTPLPMRMLSKYSLIVSYYAWAYHLLDLARGGGRVMVDLGDIMADRHERIGTRRWISLAREDEEAIVTSPSRCMAISVGDAFEFERLYGTRLPVVPFVPPDASSLLDIEPPAGMPSIGFIGAPSYLNEEILKLLAHDDFLVELRGRGITLLVAGGICGTVEVSVLDRLRSGGAQVLGRIDDVAQFYRRVTAVLNPVGPSTGVKIKSVEALVAGRGLVTTSWGTDPSLVQGFPGQIKVVNWPISPKDLARACIENLATEVPQASQAARRYIEASHATLTAHLRA